MRKFLLTTLLAGGALLGIASAAEAAPRFSAAASPLVAATTVPAVSEGTASVETVQYRPRRYYRHRRYWRHRRYR